MLCNCLVGVLSNALCLNFLVFGGLGIRSERTGREIYRSLTHFIIIPCLSEHHPISQSPFHPPNIGGGGLGYFGDSWRRTGAYLSLVIPKVHRLMNPGYI